MTTERIAQRAALLQKDEHPEDAIYWQGRSDGHGVSLINIRSRIGTNPLAELQARIAELEQQLEEARKDARRATQRVNDYFDDDCK